MLQKNQRIKRAKVAIIGAGSIGILLSQSVKALAAEKVLISDISDLSLKIAKKVGVDFIEIKKKILENQ